MIQMIPKHPETPLLHLHGGRGFVLSGGGKYRRIVAVRSLLCFWAVREPGVSLFSLSRKPGISVHSVSDSVARGQRIAEKRHLFLTKLLTALYSYDYFAISVRIVYRLIDEGDLKRTKIRGCLRLPVWEIERYEKELEREMEEV